MYCNTPGCPYAVTGKHNHDAYIASRPSLFKEIMGQPFEFDFLTFFYPKDPVVGKVYFLTYINGQTQS